MKNLSADIEFAIKNALKGVTETIDIDSVDDDKLERLVKSRNEGFSGVKEMLMLWQNSPNAPTDAKLKTYTEKLVKAGDMSLDILRQALRKEINFTGLDADKYGAAIKSKPAIFKAIQEIDSGLISLRHQLATDTVDFKEREFRIGYPERYANGEFYPLSECYKDWYDEETDSIKLCPDGSKGEIITLDGLNIMLPEVPKNKKDILFWDLPKEEQFWKRPEPPRGLTPESESAFAEYILEEFRRRRYGVWFYNNGKPTYVVGAHYMGLTHNKMLDSGWFKDFRWAQCQVYYFIKACVIDNRSLGIAFYKGRRSGFTEAALDFLQDDSTSTKNALMGMTSKTSEDVEELFSKYAYGIQNQPFFFIPVIKGKIDDKKKIDFGKVSDSSKAAKKKKDTNTDDYLNTKVDWRPSTTLAYDSIKLVRYICDEAGKRMRPQNIIDHFDNIRPTLIQGGRVVGKCYMGSTLASYDKGGKEYQEIYYASDVKKRNLNGMTSTGLYAFFIPAHKNYEDFTDKYGVCHETVPKGEFFYNQRGDKKTIGALQFLENEFASAKTQGSKTYNNRRRLDPITIEDMFRDELKGQLFDTEKIIQQINYNTRMEIDKTLARGNFKWKDGQKFTTVEWHPDSKGRFLIAWMPPTELRNKWTTKSVYGYNTKCPVDSYEAYASADPYDKDSVIGSVLKETENGVEHSGGSRGAVHGLTGTNFANAPSNFFFFEYICRPKDAEMFYEDTLMACIFFSIQILIENEKKMILDYFFRNGYRGYVVTRFDKEISRLSAEEKKYGGMPSSSKDMINRHWTSIEAYIDKYVGEYYKGDDEVAIREEGEVGSMPFNRTLRDWLNFDPDHRTQYDASISSGLAIMAINQSLYKPKNERPPLTLKFAMYSTR